MGNLYGQSSPVQVFLIHRKLRPMNQKRSARMHMPRRGKWLQKQPRGSARVPQAELSVLENVNYM